MLIGLARSSQSPRDRMVPAHVGGGFRDRLERPRASLHIPARQGEGVWSASRFPAGGSATVSQAARVGQSSTATRYDGGDSCRGLLGGGHVGRRKSLQAIRLG